jgi:hypothetical protein
LVDLALFILRQNDDARTWGALRSEAEAVVDRWLESQKENAA